MPMWHDSLPDWTATYYLLTVLMLIVSAGLAVYFFWLDRGRRCFW